MTPAARASLHSAIDVLVATRRRDSVVAVLALMSSDTDDGVMARGLIQLLPDAPCVITGEEIRAVFAARLDAMGG